jgi:DNA-binding NarL/FixJ family response regulator
MNSTAPRSTTVIGVLVADDLPLHRESLRRLLEGEPDLHVLAEAATPGEAATAARDFRPDIVVMHLSTPLRQSLLAIRAITTAAPETGVLIATPFDPGDFAFAALSAGARGFLVGAGANELLTAMRALHAGDSVLSAGLIVRLADRYADPPDRATVRRGALVDVPAVVRLLDRTHARPCAGAACDEVEQSLSQPVLRLLLAHHALKEGQMWVAERRPGEPTAAAVWLPPETDLPDRHFKDVLARELHPPAGFAMVSHRVRRALRTARPGTPHWTLITAGLLGEPFDPALADALLGPGLRTADAEDTSVLAVTATADEAARLGVFGFQPLREAEFRPGSSAWLAIRHPGHTPGRALPGRA